MTTVEDIQAAVVRLARADLARFRAWFEEFEAARFDSRIEEDAKAGKIDALAERALDQFRKGEFREL